MKWQDKHDSLKKKRNTNVRNFTCFEMFRNGDFFAKSEHEETRSEIIDIFRMRKLCDWLQANS